MGTSKTLIARRKIKKTKVKRGWKRKQKWSWDRRKTNVQGLIESWEEQSDCWFPLRKRNWQPIQSTSKHLKACGATDARDKSATFTGFCFVSLHKRQIPASKLPVSPRAHEQGLIPLGLLYRSVDRSQKKIEKKNSISKRWGIYRVYFFFFFPWNLNKTGCNSCSPADTCGSGGSRRLKCSQHP